ncbi:MAG: hypothetical protein HC905_25940 [Bacteroidales bacterium]|nr:hypothetical protein [Bacteroidales bacterium]
MKTKNKLVIFGCKDTTFECISYLINKRIDIDLLITIDPEIAEKNEVAGYFDLTEYAKNNHIQTYSCISYSLKNEIDFNYLNQYTFELGFVIGWQRLIPEWLLRKFSIGVFGMHGSAKALPFGRGRSPMNWSLIQNKSLFITNLFKYNPGIDDGDILDTQIFDLNSFDDARTVHYKNTLSLLKINRKK